jgi:hypothetical protein
VIANARRLARAHGLAPDLAARIYRAMIAVFIDDEMVEHRRLRTEHRRLQAKRVDLPSEPCAPRTAPTQFKPAAARPLQRPSP